MTTKDTGIGARVKQLRQARQMTLREVAFALGVAGNSVNRWELGTAHPQKKHIAGLSELFNVDPSWLMFGITNSNTRSKEESMIRKIRLLSSEQYKIVEGIINSYIEVEEKPKNVCGEIK